jgi:hypothetical protein
MSTITDKSEEPTKILFNELRIETKSELALSIVLAYVTPPTKSLNDPSPPIKRLFGFECVRLDVGHTAQVFFPLNSDSLLTVAHDGSKWLEPGAYRILVLEKDICNTVHLRGKAARWSSI